MKGKRRAGPVAAGSPMCSDAASRRPPLWGSPPAAPPARDARVIWHEVECGSYEADLRLWEEMAAAQGESILELGCGAGRVASYLARRGYDVSGLDSDARLIESLAGAERGDARDFELKREFGLILAPMQLVQLFGSVEERESCLRCVAAHLAPGGLAAFAIVEGMPEPIDASPPLPDTREVEGWVYSSLPIEAFVGNGEIRVRRLRQTVSPAGELTEELHELSLRELDAATLEGEARRAGLAAAGRRTVPPTADHVGSTVVLLEKEA
jgi:SAM-dependent methyltransferase